MELHQLTVERLGYPPLEYQHLRYHWVLCAGPFDGISHTDDLVRPAEWTRRRMWKVLGSSRLYSPNETAGLWQYLLPCLTPERRP